MWGLLEEKPIGRLRSNTKITSMIDSTIYLNFGAGKNEERRSTFLPEELTKEEQPFSSKEVFTVTYCGAAYMSTEMKHSKTVTKFVTGSKYRGQWNQLGFSEKGVYKYPHGVVYDGHFNRKGEFHGSGILTYPNGQRLEGFWKNGKLTQGASFVTSENNMFNEDYCTMPDRRFQIEIQTELQAADQENLTNSRTPTKIPYGCYDAGDGFYDPKLKVTKSYGKTEVLKSVNNFEAWVNEERQKVYNLLLRQTPSERNFIKHLMRWKVAGKHAIESIPVSGKEDWIKRNCRRARSQPTGYRPEFYEVWTSGARKYADLRILTDETSRRGTNMSSLLGYSVPYSSHVSDFFTIFPDLDASFGISQEGSRGTTINSQVFKAIFINNPLGLSPVYSLKRHKLRNTNTSKRSSGKQRVRSQPKSLKLIKFL